MKLTLLHVLLFMCILTGCSGGKNKNNKKLSTKKKIALMEQSITELAEKIESIESALANVASACMLPCQNGECVGLDGSWQCACDDGYTGIHCESEIPVSEPVHDCVDIQTQGLGSTNGVYEVTLPESGETKSVYCDMETDGGGWTVFQRRTSNDVDFYRNMAAYVTGFGNTSGNFWLGLNAIEQMTANNNSEMQVHLTAADDSETSVSYDHFYVGTAPEYALFVEGEETDSDDISGTEIGQWVTGVPAYSSQYNDNSWAANKVIGPNDVYPKYGDIQNTWAQNLASGKTGQYIEVTFTEDVIPTSIEIYETYNAGGVERITALVPIPGSNEYESVVLYETTNVQSIKEARIFSPALNKMAQGTKRIRIEIDNSVSGTWVEIDAVRLFGKPTTQSAGLVDSVGRSFSTFDDDKSGNNCSTLDHGAWWYNSFCTDMNLNGAYETPGTQSAYNGGQGGVIYEPFEGLQSLKETKMMFRRK